MLVDIRRQVHATFMRKVEGKEAEKKFEKAKAEINTEIEELQTYIKDNFYSCVE